jgi:hypothetical protein
MACLRGVNLLRIPWSDCMSFCKFFERVTNEVLVTHSSKVHTVKCLVFLPF